MTAGVISALMLGTVHALERFADLPPCALCLRQREIFWAAIAIAALAAGFAALKPRWRLARAFDALLGASFLTGAAVAFYHAGVEWDWWPGPPSCSQASGAIGNLRSEDITQWLADPGRVVSCEDAPVRILGLSLAGWNGVVSLVLACLSVFAAARAAPLEENVNV